MQLNNVKDLSLKNLEQEQEKNKIISEQNSMLELKVEERTAALKLEKKKSDDLLLNILPAEIAEELKNTGETQARHFDMVSVLFTDFVNFTGISATLSPSELLNELNICFKAFDAIIEKNGLEKIKTIGDAYMAAGGVPHFNAASPVDTVNAGLAMIEAVDKLNLKRAKLGNLPFEVRIGINSGPVVAGIVGIKKFAYDIWGDTVNIASRMETSGEPGRVNISSSTYNLVKDHFICTFRGKIEAKNLGQIDMYFVERKTI